MKAKDNANCTVRISQGGETELDFKIIRPRDGSANYDGKFACGRSAGFDGKEFRLPSDITCENCIMSFTQELENNELIH